LRLASLGKVWFGLSGYSELGVYDNLVYRAGELTADFTEHDEIPGVSPLSLAERGQLTQFSD
jgi:hypothetical protein